MMFYTELLRRHYIWYDNDIIKESEGISLSTVCIANNTLDVSQKTSAKCKQKNAQNIMQRCSLVVSLSMQNKTTYACSFFIIDTASIASITVQYSLKERILKKYFLMKTSSTLPQTQQLLQRRALLPRSSL